MIWESINLTYKLDPKWRNGCLSSANSKWRQYKTHLTRTFIQPNRNNPKLMNKKKSELQSARGKVNLYPHRLSGKGYAGLSKEISSDLCDDDEINRAIL
ncbi:uncharacterized protein LOC122040846 isoform X2 [Zingiber officinale]|nr:uncharacterized protein LOC122040846 isoform X2 [Zingiber officinale]